MYIPSIFVFKEGKQILVRHGYKLQSIISLEYYYFMQKVTIYLKYNGNAYNTVH